MEQHTNNQLSLAALIDLETQFERDKTLDRQTLRKREREIGLRLNLNSERSEIILQWLEQVRDPAKPLPGETANRALRQTGFLLAILGLLTGAGTAVGLFAYDGSKPVNVVNILAVFVFLQIAILALSLLIIFAAGSLKKVPGVGSIIEFLELFSPGRWLPALTKILPGESRAALLESLGRLKTFDTLYGKIRNNLLATLSQIFALCFNFGALACCLALIIFSDLAFAWSTTLQVDSGGFHKIVSTIAAPWSWLASDAAPPLELIEATRFYRLESPESIDAKQAAQWWPFLVLCIMIYGLLPRIILFAITRLRLSRAINSTPLNHAGFQRLLERLSENYCESHSEKPDNSASLPSHSGNQTNSPEKTNSTSWLVIDWCGAASDQPAVEQFFQQRFNSQSLNFQLAGSLDTRQDENALTAAAELQSNHAIAVVVKAWESPTRDFLRFLQKLRTQTSENSLITIIPMNLDSKNNITPPATDDLRQWNSKTASLGDLWLRIESPE